MNLEQLKNAWVEAGSKVSDLNAQLNAALVDDEKTEEDVVSLQAQVKAARAKRDGLKEQVANMEAEQVLNVKKEPLDKKDENLKNKFIKDFKAMVNGDPAIMATLTSNTDESGNAIGLTIPVDVQTTIHTLVRRFDSLQEYVNVEKVTTTSGSRVYEKWSNITPLTALDTEDGEIPANDDPALYLIKYLIKRYAGISTVTNSLLKDTAENILAWLSKWIAKKVVVTRNTKILAAIDGIKAAQKKDVKDVDGIKDIVNVQLDPAIEATSMFITNQDGFNVLDKVKRADGSYLLQKDVASATGYTFLGKPIKKIASRFLPNKGTQAAPKYPLYIGDLKEAVTLYDRENMSLLTTNIGGGAFETDTTKVRVIDRFDVQLVDDEAVVLATFTTIANETPAKV
ncbi:phage major capsid protein, HK97 family [Enterococcus faecium E980]|uniref:phage major capsid protein n=1 Tax=Enterococcus TaxID=1350 RepID=UPI0001CEAEEF|nr:MULTISPECIES: phage major capsid protein [Enterococcus]EFF38327.1 phage major capsid protein, HK97 family [Enterococcus faecium E980]MDB7510113.1 phage major capsid protein [Enterococcus faecium]MDB7517766.1 phage major capsid protein [Enterococcus faecium]MDK4444173.1 phage major capsid protein [Enterococcus faecium]WPG23467.1 phage major capsid protein [Enterococcus faecium]